MTNFINPISHTPRVVLITGGAGFIGSNHVRYLLETDASVQVINLDALTYAGNMHWLEGLDQDRHHFVQGDICDRPLVKRLLQEYQIDTIIHFAAESHVDRSINGPDAFVKTNIEGTFSLLESARQVWQHRTDTRFHHISTDEVYGSLQETDPAFTETTPYAPNSPYSASKAASDHLVRAYFHTYQLPITMSNCSNNYGPHQHAEKLIPTIIRSLKNQQPVPVYGDGKNIRDWLYVADHCRAVDAIIRRGRLGETYNIGGMCANEISAEQRNIEIVQQICTIMDQRFPDYAPHTQYIQFVTDRLGHDWRYAINHHKITSELGWNPIESFDTGLQKTVDWALS